MADVHYDAFISYRHTKKDAFVAKTIHQMLEHYKIPRHVQHKSGKKRIERVFRDEEELSLASDLTQELIDALTASDYLILICSEESMKSKWVARELEEFLKTHKKNRVLTVVIDDKDPKEIVPQCLFEKEKEITLPDGTKNTVTIDVEPRMAMVDGSSQKEILKKIKSEKLRLLAPMLGCSFEDLKRRNQEYRYKKRLYIGGVILAVALLFSCVTVYQGIQIKKQYKTANQNQERYLTEISKDLLSDGDREGAIKVAMAIQNKNEKNAVIPEQIGILNQALNNYDNDDNLFLRPVKKISEQVSSVVSSFSEDGKTFMNIDSFGKVTMIDADSKNILWEFSKDDFVSDGDLYYTFGWFYDNDSIIAGDSRGIYCIDFRNHKILWSESLPYKFDADASVNYAVEGNNCILAIGGYALIYDLSKSQDRCIYQYKYDSSADKEADNLSYTVYDAAINSSGKLAAIALENKTNNKKGILYFNPSENEHKMIENNVAKKIIFSSENIITSILYDESSNDSYIEIYDLQKEKVLLQTDRVHLDIINNTYGLTQTDDSIAGYIRGFYFVIDKKENRILSSNNCGKQICNMSVLDSFRIYIVLENGAIRLYIYNFKYTGYDDEQHNLDQFYNYIGGISTNVSNVCFNRGKYEADGSTQYVVEKDGLIFIEHLTDDSMITLSKHTSLKDTKWYTDSSGQMYRAISTELGNMGILNDEKDEKRIQVFRKGESKAILTFAVNSNSDIKDFSFQEKKDGLYFTCIIQRSDKKYSVNQVSISDGSITRLWDSSQLKDGSIDDISLSKDGKYIFLGLHKERKYAIISLCNPDRNISWISLPSFSNNFSKIDQMIINNNADYIFLEVSDTYSSHSSIQHILCYDRKKGSYVSFDGQTSLNKNISINDIVCSDDQSPMFSYFTANEHLRVADAENGKIIMDVKIEYDEDISYAFIHQNKYLIVLIDHSMLSIYRIEDATKVMSEDFSNTYYQSIAVDPTGDYFLLNQADHYLVKDEDFNMYNEEDSIEHSDIYYFDKNGNFTKWATLPEQSYINFKAGEIVYSKLSSIGYFKILSYQELTAKAKEVVGDITLTDEDLKRYSISK